MPTPTYTPLANTTLGSSASSVTFSSISGAYRDLVLVINGQLTGVSGTWLRFNSDTGSNYPFVLMKGDSSGTSSQATGYDRFYYFQNYLTSGSRFMATTQIMDYSATDKHKTSLVRGTYTQNVNGSTVAEAQATRWANTAAINTILVGIDSNQYAAGTTFSLYGIVA
jgi:hypothetical protein